jgi:hypothetical protein
VKSGGLVVESSEAWGETARGCYAAWLALASRPARPAKLAEDLVEGIQTESTLAPITLVDVVKPTATTDADVLAFSFEKAPYHGKLRARVVKDGHVTALVCFWNEREPAACQASCDQMLGGLK